MIRVFVGWAWMTKRAVGMHGVGKGRHCLHRNAGQKREDACARQLTEIYQQQCASTRPLATRRPSRFFTILSSNNVPTSLSERRTAMKPEDELPLRSEVRDSVFRAERMHRAGRPVEAAEQLAGELAAAQARLAELGHPDPAGTLLHWRGDDEAAYALAELVADLVAERIRRPVPPQAAAPAPASTPYCGDTATPQYAFPAPSTDVPALADLLDDMLSRESRARR